MYGISKRMREFAREKLSKQKFYLDNNFIETQSGVILPLSDVVKTPYFNNNRYISEVQHRVWSLHRYAEHRGLVNVFLTLTLPSEYHPTRKIVKNGLVRIVKNRKYKRDGEHTVKKGARELSRMFKILRHRRFFRNIPNFFI